MEFQGQLNLTVENYNFTEYWSQSTAADVLILDFDKQLKTIISEI
nr:hypothetical protein [Candidatus Brachybacter algidus]